ncbi:EAL domain-containing protein (putative c-di-GMP-specific phosphodiesterase class I) [Actinoplanes lutulentus]|uniref:EAL domain-containing protein (Putative c-di-GMP-specific phosphodiesterase class I) n=1 Tax=Actinoplanes lutulentus TaxID=1287878 RepID=A0A327Z9Z0_9ACTN|nr:EAL domain-containing protein [Actinoplanes lutulentus]MBB2947146.1 EAL domain-containing protein (putative c-di-GMP-specific phosphodiesterase class I) [Actinoplanes lutulentus]RAK36422.1 EAL domain-containing protein (putative c-di-GMP-specific phosphodiesterase class I) [Actinoplanes lutulentus]
MQTLETTPWQPGLADIAEVDRLLNLVRTHLGVDVAFVSAFVADQQMICAATGAVEAMRVQVGQGRDLKDSYCERVLSGALPGVVNDARRHPVARDLASTRDLRIGSYVGVPWRGPDGDVAGMLCCISRYPDPSLDDQSVRYMGLIADVISDHMSSPVAQERHAAAVARRTVQNVLDRESVRMVFQPVVRLRDRETVGFEALARFDPEVFARPDIAFAEAARCGLGVALELLALRQAVRRLPDLPDGTWLAVNLSAEALLDAEVRDTLLAHAGTGLTVEITEHAQVENYDLLTGALDSLRRAGIRLSIDDAGAGYASLHHVLKLRPDIIKLDISLVRDVDTDIVKIALARSLNDFAVRIGATLIAEGVESPSESARLAEIGVDCAQGYHFARPAELPVTPSAA